MISEETILNSLDPMDREEFKTTMSRLAEEEKEFYLALIATDEKGEPKEVFAAAKACMEHDMDPLLWAGRYCESMLRVLPKKEAWEEIRTLSDRYPKSSELLFQRVMFLQRENRKEEALNYLEHASRTEFSALYYLTYTTFLADAKNPQQLMRSVSLYEEAHTRYLTEGKDAEALLMNELYTNWILFSAQVLKEEDVLNSMKKYRDYINTLYGWETEQNAVINNLVRIGRLNTSIRVKRFYTGMLETLKKEFFTTDKTKEILNALFCMGENDRAEKDRKIPEFAKDLVGVTAQYLITDSMKDFSGAVSGYFKNYTAKTRNEYAIGLYFCGKRVPVVYQEFAYLKAYYPYTYENLLPFVEAFKKNPRKEALAALDMILSDENAYTKEQCDALYNQKFSGGKEAVKSRKTGRNDPCPCGSGKKFKNCCMA